VKFNKKAGENTGSTFRVSAWLALLVACAVLSVSSLGAATNKISSDLRGIPPGTQLDVIIQFTHPPMAADVASIRSLGGFEKIIFQNIPAGLFHIAAAALPALQKNPAITWICPDRKVSGALEFAEPAINANIALQYGWNGTGVGVAVIDSGLYNHPDLNGRIAYAESFVQGDTSTNDAYGHGTHVAGIVGGNGASSTGNNYLYTFKGIAPAATIVNLRVLNANGQGTDSAVISAIDRAIAVKNTYGIRVINLSLGRTVMESYTLDPLCQEVEKAWQAGLVVVVAAGNDGRNNSMGTSGYGTITSPGNDPYAITVGAMKDMQTTSRGDDVIASYSSKGPTLLDHVVKPDLVAPGNKIASALAPNSWVVQNYPGNIDVSYYRDNNTVNISNTYFRLSGTSMAAPMVSGAAALLLQQHPSLTPDQVKLRLMKTSTKAFPSTSIATDPVTGISYTSTYDLFTIGAGYLDVWAALNNTDMPSGSAASPSAIFDSSSGKTYVVMAPGSMWVTAADTAVVWGTSVIQAADTAVVWGTTTIQAADIAVVWGTGVAWGVQAADTAVVWGTQVVWGTSAPSPLVAIAGDN
jgi:serine protease AprX